MPDPILATDPLETRRRRARFRAWHRGMKEADLVIGGFADRRMAAFTEAQLVQFEALLVEADTDITGGTVSVTAWELETD